MKLLKALSCLVGLLLLHSSQQAMADVSLPAVLGSHMVMQRDKPLPVWGWAAPGEEITVTLGKENEASTKADVWGKWQVKLKPMQSGGGPLKLVVAGKNTVELTDVLIGEVWVASGQSNMQLPVSQSNDAQKEIAAADFPKIRLFYVPRVPSGTPAFDVEADWTVCTPATATEFSAVAYFFGRELFQKLDVPIGLIHSSWGGTKIEPWIPPVGFASQKELKEDYDQIQAHRARYQVVLKRNLTFLRPWLAAAEKAAASGSEIPEPPSFPSHPLKSAGQPTGLYNGMVHPLIPFAIRGAIWYQGESNRGDGMEYYTKMKALIHGWRTVWKQGDFPFYYVQLAPYRYGGNNQQLPEIWEAQTKSLSIKNTGMAVTTDIGEFGDIHPKNKQDVGKRLSLWALAKTYGKKDVVYSGPLYESMEIDFDQVVITFKHAQGGLLSRDKKPLTWFTIAGADQRFVPANVKVDGNRVTLHATSVLKPKAVRFGWDQLANPNLVNKAGLPASPFRTDSWDTGQPAFRFRDEK